MMMRVRTLLIALGTSALVGGASLTTDLIYTFPLEKDCVALDARGNRLPLAVFRRNSQATRSDLTLADYDEPRFERGGIWMENGGGGFVDRQRQCENLLSAAVADMESVESLRIQGKADVVPGLQGRHGCRLRGELSVPFTAPYGDTLVLSWYQRGGAVTVSVSPERRETFAGSVEWRRHHLLFKASKAGQAFDLRWQSQGGELDGLMLEPIHGFYVNRRTPSSWVPGGEVRKSDNLRFTLPQGLEEAGTIGLRFTPTGLAVWNCLFSAGSWSSPLSLSITRYGRTLEAHLWGQTLQASLPPCKDGVDYSFVLAWNEKRGCLYFNGKQLLTHDLPPVSARKRLGGIMIGGSLDDSSPNIRAEGQIRDFCLWGTCLADEAVGRWSGVSRMEDGLPVQHVEVVTVARVFPRDLAEESFRWKALKPVSFARCRLGTGEWSGAELGSDGMILWRFQPSLWGEGKHELQLQTRFQDGTEEQFKLPLTMVPARVPWKNTQICTWNEWKDYFGTCGVTIGGVGDWDPGSVDRLASSGVYSQYNWVFDGRPRRTVDGDWGLGTMGQQLYPNILSPYIRQSVQDQARRMANQLMSVPGLRMLIINTERHTGSWEFDFSAKNLAAVKERFGIDMTPGLKVTKRWRIIMPGGRLEPKVFGGGKPQKGILPDEDPLYGFHRWWHGPQGATEVVMNDLLAEAVNSRHPDVLTAQDPIGRRPPLRTYTQVRVAEDWCYYPELTSIVRYAEQNGALARGQRDMVASTMPQFLLKTGMAAPFSGMPTVDMFREAVWLVCSRPTRLITFWNVQSAFEKGKQKTAEEIAELVDEKGIPKSKGIAAWEPGLKDEFQRLSEQLIRPFGALLPRWRNATRRLAVVRSFVSELYGGERWPNGGWLMQTVVAMGVPYDLVLDNDLEKPGSLDDYDVIVMPRLMALTASMAEQLRRAQQRGTLLVADEACRVELPGLLRLRCPTKDERHKSALATLRKEEAWLKKIGDKIGDPLFVEAMTEVREAQKDVPELRQKLMTMPRAQVLCQTSGVYWNHLHAEDADYLVAVNDWRVSGPLYGRYGKVRERGVKGQGVFTLKDDWRHAWDLQTGKQVELQNGRMTLDLEPCSGRVIMLTRKLLGTLTMDLAADGQQGEFLTCKVTMPAEGLIPLRVKLLRPDGTVDSVSHHTVLTRGRCELKLPIPREAATGTWTVWIREAARGQVVAKKVRVR